MVISAKNKVKQDERDLRAGVSLIGGGWKGPTERTMDEQDLKEG